MKLDQLYEAIVGLSQPTGSYVAMKLSDDAIRIIQELQNSLSLKNPVPAEKLHLTLMYSMKQLNASFQCSTKPISDVLEYTYEWFGPDSDCLVIKLTGKLGDKLKTRHNEIAAYGGEHTYTPFEPHITLSYGEPEDSMDSIQRRWSDRLKMIGVSNFKLVSEYHEPIDNKWSDDLKK